MSGSTAVKTGKPQYHCGGGLRQPGDAPSRIRQGRRFHLLREKDHPHHAGGGEFVNELDYLTSPGYLTRKELAFIRYFAPSESLGKATTIELTINEFFRDLEALQN